MVYQKSEKCLQRCNGPCAYAGNCTPKAPPPPSRRPLPLIQVSPLILLHNPNLH
jgi:hypothetical protein